jgi:hypothetical protein
MRTRSKLVLVGLGATLLMALAIGSASARTFSITNQNIRVAFRNLEFEIEGISTTTCRVTLEGSLHSRTIAKVRGALIGYLTRVSTNNCNNGVTILTETLPWHIRYESFSGILPNITLILIRSSPVSFRVEGGFGISCLARGELGARFIRIVPGGQLRFARIERQSLPLTGAFCPSTGAFRSAEDGLITLLGNNNLITVTLI